MKAEIEKDWIVADERFSYGSLTLHTQWRVGDEDATALSAYRDLTKDGFKALLGPFKRAEGGKELVIGDDFSKRHIRPAQIEKAFQGKDGRVRVVTVEEVRADA